MRKIDFNCDKFAIIGVGISGRSIYNYLKWRNAEIVAVLDTRVQPPAGIEQQAIIAGKLDYANLAMASVIVLSPGVSIYEPELKRAVANGKLLVGDIELLAQAIANWPTKVIGISGSNGKTTVTSLIGFLASQAGINTVVAGNIGKPVLEALIEIEARHAYPQLMVLELSSFQLETVYSLKLASGIVLNICEDHLDRYRDVLEYAYAKANIFNYCETQILNGDDPLVMAMLRRTATQILFAQSNAAYCLKEQAGNTFLSVNDQLLVNVNQLQLVGNHNYLNCLASLAALAGAGFAPDQFSVPLTKFGGLEHRMQKIAEHRQVIFIEDSKGTNVGAVLAGVGGLPMPVHLILGGDGKGQDFMPLRSLVMEKCASVALIGKDAQLLAQVLSGIANVQQYVSLEQAVLASMARAKPGDAVVLSPACASWDMFTDYKQRAQVFIDTVYAAIQNQV